MTELIVKVDDASLLPDLKRAIKLLRGVASIAVKKEKPVDVTLQAMRDAEEGRTVKCMDFEDYLKKVQCWDLQEF